MDLIPYIVVTLFLAICVILSWLFIDQKHHALQKVRSLRIEEKRQILSDLAGPMGFIYDPWQDIFTSKVDAWQRHYDYCIFFDHTAPFFQMVFDYEPVYFDYKGKTWLIEFWKGQYGINTGCEVGIYRSDALLAPSQRENAHYHAVSDEEMLPMQISLYRRGHLLFTLSRRHWWLTGFCMGIFSKPEDLHLSCAVTFPDPAMLHAFTNALREKGYGTDRLRTEGKTAAFHFTAPAAPQHAPEIRRALSQWKNRLSCKIYRQATRPFHKNIDRLLYLYYFLPSAFRKALYIQKTDMVRRP